MPSPNILLITSDQQHYATLGVNNPDIKTPNLDRLARMGVRFDRAYCPNPTCTPTRASIITGQYPSVHGAWTLGTKLDDDAPTIGALLHDAGYGTSLIGKAHFQPLTHTEEHTSVEAYPTLRDLDFWRNFNDQQTPWYGFDHVELARNHADEGHVGQHYAIWMQEQGLEDWQSYFQPRRDNERDTPGDASRALPVLEKQIPGGRGDQAWPLPESMHYTAWTGQRTIAAIQRAAAAKQPFFIWSSYHDPHPPYCVPEPWHSMYDPADMKVGEYSDGEFDDMPPPHQLTRDTGASFRDSFGPFERGVHGYHCHQTDPEILRKAQAIYYGMISFMDHWIGQTLDALEQAGQLNQTLIVFTSDHGHFLGQHGLVAKGPFHYEDVIRVPMIAAWADRLPAGQASESVQSLVDLAPTFAGAAGLTLPAWMQGIDRLDEWAGKSPCERPWAIVENHHDGAAVHLRTYVSQRYKLTIYRGQPWGELFDLRDDPEELHNRFDDPAYRDIRALVMQEMLQAELEREYMGMPRIGDA